MASKMAFYGVMIERYGSGMDQESRYQIALNNGPKCVRSSKATW
jgi:hypothetical protein